MGLSFNIGDYSAEIGSASFLHCFFSTISYHLEPQGWGSKYPELMNDLYQGSLDASKVEKLLNDLEEIRNMLKNISPEKVIWDIDHLTKRTPWGENISPNITDLSNYFVTSDGKDLFEVLKNVLEQLKKNNGELTIR